MDNIYVLDRIEERHPDVTKEDAAHAWEYCIRSMPRLDKNPSEYVGIGYDGSGRLLEVIAIRNNQGDWLVIHAQTPPQERVKRELGFGRRKS